MIIITNIKTFESSIHTTKTGAAKELSTTDQTILKYLKNKTLFKDLFMITEADINRNIAKKKAKNWLKTKV
jgi:hypothetical protein